MNFIFGAGITGLVAALYYKEYFILAKDFGQEQIGPRILRRTEYVDSFLEKFKIHLSSRIYKCGYVIDEKINHNTKIHNTISLIEKANYLKKTNREELKNTMNDGITEMEGYDMTELYEIIFKRVFDRIVLRKLLKIDTEKKIIIGKQDSYHYDEIINTLPVSIFNSLLGYPAVTRGTIYADIFKSEFFIRFLAGFDFLYFAHPAVPFYRITKHKGDIFSSESMHPFVWDFANTEVLKIVKMPFGKITKNIQPLMVKDVLHLGRYATNNQAIRLDAVIKFLENEK